MNILTYFDEDDVAFLRTPKFLRRLATPHAAELFALLRERRRWLVDKKKIRSHASWFFFQTKDLQENLLPPNSINHIKGLLKILEELNLVEIRVDERPPFTKFYKLNDETYLALAKQEALKLTKKIERNYDEFQDRGED